ncbi:MAG: hypothetical protein ACKO4U_00805 [Caldilinea sp.]
MPPPGPSEPLVQLTVYRYGLVLKQWLDPDTTVEYPSRLFPLRQATRILPT